MDLESQHPLPHGNRWHLPVADRTDHFLDPALRPDFLEISSRTREGILHHPSHPRNRAHWRLHFARPVPLLLLLGSYADPHDLADRNVRPRTQGLRCREVFSVHDDRLCLHAGRDPLAIRANWHVRLRHSSQPDHTRRGTELPSRGTVALPRLLPGIRRQSASVPFPHLVA